MVAHAGAPFLRAGGVGVDIFFVLSGFLISSILIDEWRRRSDIALGQFYIRRALRLVPCLCMTVAFFVLYHRLLGDPFSFVDPAVSLTYTMNWARALDYLGMSALRHTWSLGIEEQFYLLWPLALTVLLPHVNSRASLARFLIAAAIGFGVYRYAMAGSYSDQRIYFGLDTHCDGLLWGAAMVPISELLRNASLHRFWHLVLGRVIVPLALLAMALMAWLFAWGDDWMWRFGFGAVAIASSALVLDLVAGRCSVLRGVLEIPVLRWLGKISYGLYLWHFPIYDLLNRLHIGSGWKTRFLIGGSCTVAVAAISYYGVERHFLKLKDRFHATSVEGPDSLTAASQV